jgi:predicted kinase
LAPPAPRLIAVGGLSGSGKSTLAAALAPDVGLPLGALHIRTDMERKAMMGVEPTDRLPPEYYTPDSARQVYERVLRRARAGLGAGQCVIVDAVFATGDERTRAAQLARDLGVAFDGLWLDADPDILRHRVGQRQGDASDATRAVVDRQLGYDLGDLNWVRVLAGGTPEATLAAARSALELAAAGP